MAIDGVIKELALCNNVGLLLTCGGELVLRAMFAACGRGLV